MDKYTELDRVQAELQIMWYLGGAPYLHDQLAEYAEDVAALLRSEGVWAVSAPGTLYGRAIHVERDNVNLSAVVLCVSCVGIKSRDVHCAGPPTHYHYHNGMQGLVVHMRGWRRRKELWEATLQRCGSCLYSNSTDNPMYCGAGAEMYTGNCKQREPKQLTVDITLGDTTS